MASVVHAGGLAERRPGALSGGRQHPSGTGSTDGGDLRTPGGSAPAGGLCFDRHVPPGGYLWWYIDALSDDGTHGLTVIAFVGSVFSPYYAWARRRGNADPFNHCALNVALYGPRAGRWSMTERAAAAVARARSSLAIGRSTLNWDGTALQVSIDEVCAPIPTRLRGTLRLTPSVLGDSTFMLDESGLHQWTTLCTLFAPRAAVARAATRVVRRGVFRF